MQVHTFNQITCNIWNFSFVAKSEEKCPHEGCTYTTKNPSNLKAHLLCSHTGKVCNVHIVHVLSNMFYIPIGGKKTPVPIL